MPQSIDTLQSTVNILSAAKVFLFICPPSAPSTFRTVGWTLEKVCLYKCCSTVFGAIRRMIYGSTKSCEKYDNGRGHQNLWISMFWAKIIGKKTHVCAEFGIEHCSLNREKNGSRHSSMRLILTKRLSRNMFTNI